MGSSIYIHWVNQHRPPDLALLTTAHTYRNIYINVQKYQYTSSTTEMSTGNFSEEK
jgi:hypothetical protein